MAETSIFIRFLRNIKQTFSHHWFLIFWTLLNLFLFWETFSKYQHIPEYFYLREMLGPALAISRGSAPIMGLSCALIALPVNRGIHFILGNIHSGILARWLQCTKHLHLVFAGTILVGAIVHSVAHIVNAINFSKFYNHKQIELNWATHQGQNPLLLLLGSWVGITGFLMLVVLTLITLTSLRCFRTTYYTRFWAAHYLAIPFLILLLFHPFSGVLKEQINAKEHVPGCLNGTVTHMNIFISRNLTQSCQANARFLPIKSIGWIWPAIALFICAIDFAFRCNGTCNCITSKQAHVLPGSAVELTFEVDYLNYKFKPGQYILLRSPQISPLEFHPFTIAKCPTPKEQHFSIIASVKGDWTSTLYQKVTNINSYNATTGEELTFSISGPFSSPMQCVLQTNVAVCIATGVGITPFYSIIHHLIRHSTPKPRRLHLIWLVRDFQQVLWCSEELFRFHEKLWSQNQPDRFQIAIYVTRKNNSNILLLNPLLKYPYLHNRVFEGRPNWDTKFREWISLYSKNEISVFSCGTKSLNCDIRKYCYKYNRKGYTFKFIKESFS